MRTRVLALFLLLVGGCVCIGPRICKHSSGAIVDTPAHWVSLAGTERMPSVDYNMAALAARLSWLSYLPDDSIRTLGDVYIKEIGNVGAGGTGIARQLTGIKFFIWFDTAQKRQWVVIRGTNNLENVIEDALYPKVQDPVLGLWVHMGVHSVTTRLTGLVQDSLRPGYDTYLTGHSLGGAVSLLMYLRFHVQGDTTLGPLYTFAQPRVLAEAGVKHFRCLPIIRFVKWSDPVPLLPPTVKGCHNKASPGCHGPYEHVGDEVVLLDNRACVYETAQHPETAVAGGVLQLLITVGQALQSGQPLDRLLQDRLKKYLPAHLPNVYDSTMKELVAAGPPACKFCCHLGTHGKKKCFVECPCSH